MRAGSQVLDGIDTTSMSMPASIAELDLRDLRVSHKRYVATIGAVSECISREPVRPTFT
jgi:hypothetical protein